MATIGIFSRHDDGTLIGTIRTLTLDTPAQLEPLMSATEGAPAFRLYAGDIELGAAWAKTAKETGREYHQVRLDDPSFPAPIFANLIGDDSGDLFSLIWTRPRAPQKGRGLRRPGGTRRGPAAPEATKRTSARHRG